MAVVIPLIAFAPEEGAALAAGATLAEEAGPAALRGAESLGKDAFSFIRSHTTGVAKAAEKDVVNAAEKDAKTEAEKEAVADARERLINNVAQTAGVIGAIIPQGNGQTAVLPQGNVQTTDEEQPTGKLVSEKYNTLPKLTAKDIQMQNAPYPVVPPASTLGRTASAAGEKNNRRIIKRYGAAELIEPTNDVNMKLSNPKKVANMILNAPETIDKLNTKFNEGFDKVDEGTKTYLVNAHNTTTNVINTGNKMANSVSTHAIQLNNNINAVSNHARNTANNVNNTATTVLDTMNTIQAVATPFVNGAKWGYNNLKLMFSANPAAANAKLAAQQAAQNNNQVSGAYEYKGDIGNYNKYNIRMGDLPQTIVYTGAYEAFQDTIEREGGATRGGADNGCGCNGGFFGGSEFSNSDPLKTIKEYDATLSAETKKELVKRLANALGRVGIDGLNPDDDISDIAKVMMEKLPNPKNGRSFSNDAHKQEKVCKVIAEVLNDEFTPGSHKPQDMLIDTSMSAEHLCRSVAEWTNSMTNGINNEFMAVHTGVKNALRNIEVLSAILTELHDKISEQIDLKGDDDLNRNVSQFLNLYRHAETERRRQESMLKNILHIQLPPAHKALESALQYGSDLNPLIKKIGLKPGSSAFADMLTKSVSSIGATAATAAAVHKALSNAGLTVQEYVNSESVSALREKLDEILYSMPASKTRPFIDAVKTLLNNFNDRNLLSSEDHVRSHNKKHGGYRGGDEDDYQGGYRGGDDEDDYRGGDDDDEEDTERYRTEMEKRATRSKTDKRLLAQDFVKRMSKHYDDLLLAIKALAPHLGKEIPVNDLTEHLRDALIRMNDLRAERIELAIIGLYRRADARAKKEKFVNGLRLVSSTCAELMGLEMYREGSTYLAKVKSVIDSIERTIDYFSDVIVKKFGSYEHNNGDENGDENEEHYLNELHEGKHGRAETRGGDAVDEIKILMPDISKSGISLNEAVNEFAYFYYIAKVRTNLVQTSKELDVYGEKYVELLGDAVAIKLWSVNSERKKLLNVHKTLASGGADIDATWRGPGPFSNDEVGKTRIARLKIHIEREYSAKEGLYRTLQAVDLYMKAFTSGIVKDPDAIRDIKKILDGTQVIARWFDDTTGDSIWKAFAYMGSADDGTAPAMNDLNLNQTKIKDGKHFYQTIGELDVNAVNEVTNGGAVVAAGLDVAGTVIARPDASIPLSGDALENEKFREKHVVTNIDKCFDNFQALKNLVNAFVRIGESFGGRELRSQVFMSPAQIYKNLLNYLKASALSLNHDKGLVQAAAVFPAAALDKTTTNYAANAAAYAAVNIRPYQIYFNGVAKDVAAVANNTIGNYEVEDKYFVMIVKAMSAKILTTLGVYDMFERVTPITSLTPTRLIVGGADGFPEVISEASELYFRMPRLIEFYRTVLHKDTLGDDADLIISFIPEVEGIFSDIITLIFRKMMSGTVENGDYSDREVKILINEINNIYKFYADKNKDTACRAALEGLVAEINRRYGAIKNSDIKKYRQLTDQLNDVEVILPGLNKTSYEILPDENSFEVQRRAPSDRYINNPLLRDLAEGGIPRELKNRTELKDEHMILLNDFRKRIEETLDFHQRHQNDPTTKRSYGVIIKQAQTDIKLTQSDADKFKIVLNLIQGNSHVKIDSIKSLMFNETVVMGLNTLGAITTYIDNFEKKLNDVKIVEGMIMDSLYAGFSNTAIPPEFGYGGAIHVQVTDENTLLGNLNAVSREKVEKAIYRPGIKLIGLNQDFNNEFTAMDPRAVGDVVNKVVLFNKNVGGAGGGAHLLAGTMASWILMAIDAVGVVEEILVQSAKAPVGGGVVTIVRVNAFSTNCERFLSYIMGNDGTQFREYMIKILPGFNIAGFQEFIRHSGDPATPSVFYEDFVAFHESVMSAVSFKRTFIDHDAAGGVDTASAGYADDVAACKRITMNNSIEINNIYSHGGIKNDNIKYSEYMVNAVLAALHICYTAKSTTVVVGNTIITPALLQNIGLFLSVSGAYVVQADPNITKFNTIVVDILSKICGVIPISGPNAVAFVRNYVALSAGAGGVGPAVVIAGNNYTEFIQLAQFFMGTKSDLRTLAENGYKAYNALALDFIATSIPILNDAAGAYRSPWIEENLFGGQLPHAEITAVKTSFADFTGIPIDKFKCIKMVAAAVNNLKTWVSTFSVNLNPNNLISLDAYNIWVYALDNMAGVNPIIYDAVNCKLEAFPSRYQIKNNVYKRPDGNNIPADATGDNERTILDVIRTTTRIIYDPWRHMYEFLEDLFALTDNNLIECRFPNTIDRKIQLNFTKFRDLIENLFSNTKKYLEKLRPYVSKDVYDRFNDLGNTGSIHWLERNLMDKRIRNIDQSEASKRTLLDGISRLVNEVYCRLTDKRIKIRSNLTTANIVLVNFLETAAGGGGAGATNEVALAKAFVFKSFFYHNIPNDTYTAAVPLVARGGVANANAANDAEVAYINDNARNKDQIASFIAGINQTANFLPDAGGAAPPSFVIAAATIAAAFTKLWSFQQGEDRDGVDGSENLNYGSIMSKILWYNPLEWNSGVNIKSRKLGVESPNLIFTERLNKDKSKRPQMYPTFIPNTQVPNPENSGFINAAQINASRYGFYDNTRNITECRSVLFAFNDLVYQYLQTFVDQSNIKIYTNLINGFANGVAASTINNPAGRSYPDMCGYPGVGFGVRGDPGKNVLLMSSLAYMIQRLVKDVNPMNQSADHLISTLMDVPLYIKESYRVNLPGFIRLFNNLIQKVEFLKNIIQKTDINLRRIDNVVIARDMIPAAKQPLFDNVRESIKVIVTPPRVLMFGEIQFVFEKSTDENFYGNNFIAALDNYNSVGTNDQMRLKFMRFIDLVVNYSYGIVSSASDTLRELADRPLYAQTYDNFIDNYKMRNKKDPLMPLSYVMTFLKNSESVINTHDDIFPNSAIGEPPFKLQYAVRGIFTGQNTVTMDSMPGVKNIIDVFNASSMKKDNVNYDEYTDFAKYVLSAVNYFMDAKHYKDILHSIYTPKLNENDLFSTVNLCSEAAGPLKLPDERAAANEIYNRLGNTVWSLHVELSNIAEKMESANQEDTLSSLTRVVRGRNDDNTTTRLDEIKYNIIDMNIIPINVHALMRDIPLANLYNYNYTFEQLICNMYGKTREHINLLAHDTITNVKDLFIKLLIDPYFDLHLYTDVTRIATFGVDTVAVDKGILGRLFTGDGDIGLGRPKFLSDQLFNKALFRNTFNFDAELEVNPLGIDRLIVTSLKYPTVNGNNEMVLNSKSITTAAVRIGVKTKLEQIGAARFDTRFVRNLFFLTNMQRVVRLKLNRELTHSRNVILKSHESVSTGVTEYGSDPFSIQETMDSRIPQGLLTRFNDSDDLNDRYQ